MCPTLVRIQLASPPFGGGTGAQKCGGVKPQLGAVDRASVQVDWVRWITMSQERTLPATCEQTVSALTATLALHGYRIERSFDLRNALDNHGGCPCPHHGTIYCTCQYVVLLIYEVAALAPPALVTAHACDGIIRLHVEAGQPGGRLASRLTMALDEAMSALPLAPALAGSARPVRREAPGAR